MIPLARLTSQHLLTPALTNPGDEVRSLVAVQAQDYAAARWSLGQRLKGATAATIDRAFDEGVILRTHLLRPTWHFVVPDDIRWLLALSAPRIAMANARVARKYGLDEGIFAKSRRAISRALRERSLSRQELKHALERAGIPIQSGQQLAYLVMDSELAGIACSGPRRGGQFTYMLLERRAPAVRALERDEALAELAQRYFVSHGPATVRDLAKWSWLTLADARRAAQAAAPGLVREEYDGETYFAPPTLRRSRRKWPPAAPIVHLLSIYDEYLVGYKTLNTVCRTAWGGRLVGMGNALNYVVIINGEIAGTWRRTIDRDCVNVETTMFRGLSPDEGRARWRAAERFARFHGLGLAQLTDVGGKGRKGG